jgi:hypothetical protein
VYPGYGNISDPSRGCTSEGIYDLCDGHPAMSGSAFSFWGSSIASLPGFGTNWGSFSQLGEREYEGRLAYTLARLNGIRRRAESAPRDSDAPRQQPERMLTPDEVSGLIEDIHSLFKAHSQCEDFMNSLLGELKTTTGYQASSNIGEALESFKRDGHIFTTGSVNGSSVVGPEGIHLSFRNTREETAAVVLGEIIHAVGFAGNNAYTDTAMANAAYNLGVVMSAEQFRHTYPQWVAKYKADYEKAFPGVPGRDYVESKLAHGAIDIKCRDIVNGLLPKYAKP